MKPLATLIAIWAISATLSAQIPDFSPQTPLIGALLHDDLDAAERLLDQGVNPNAGRFVGFSPLLLAVMRSDVPLVRALVAKGADLNVRDASGATALMWAAFNETGDAAMVEALLDMGADPHATNKVGDTALTWGLRRGETPAVAALRRAGARQDAQVRRATEKALALLQRSGAQFMKVSGCASCHHQALPQMALGIARTRGLAVDEPAAQQQVAAALAMLEPILPEARANRDRIPDPPIGLSYTLLGFSGMNHPRDEATAAMSDVIAAWQDQDGAFRTLPAIRPPIESSHVTATTLSLRALQLFGRNADARIERARTWLLRAKPQTTEERAMHLLGLAWAKAPASDIRKSTRALLDAQRPDGGWAQLPALETDAYATGQALVALYTAGQGPTSAAYARGLGFLIRTQFQDGSWLVRTRTFPVQPPKDSGFPHGTHQWISAAGTSWAAMALALALPEVPSSEPCD